MKDFEPVVFLGEDGPLRTALERAGVRVEIVEISERTRNASSKKIGLLQIALGHGLDAVRYSLQLRRRIRAENPTVIVSNTMKSHVFVCISGIWKSVPYVAYIRDMITSEFMSGFGVRLIRSVLRLAPAGVIANSTATLATVPAALRNRKSLVLPSPIQDPPTKASGSSNNRVCFALVGRISPWKGQDLAIRALNEARKDVDCELRIIGGPLFGENEYESELRALTKELGLNGFVEFRGHVDCVYDHLEDVDSVVHCSTIPEPFGQVVVQGMAMGLPVIASGEGGPSEVIIDGVTGLLFEPRSVEDLARKMTRLCRDPKLRFDLGSNALPAASEYFSPVVTKRFEGFIASMVAGSASK
ncbi:glycosyltransferase [Rhodococcus hoagii]|nr:glycosyltransferase [Prescottella equi]